MICRTRRSRKTRRARARGLGRDPAADGLRIFNPRRSGAHRIRTNVGGAVACLPDGRPAGTLAPGAELAAALASIDLAELSGFDCVEVLEAQFRQANHERARFLAAVAEVVLPDDPWGTGTPDGARVAVGAERG